MSKQAKKVAQQAEERLDRVARSARQQFDKITEGRFTDKVREGRFADRGDGTDRDRGEGRGGSAA
ncbi:hypothetical protein [Micromonospora sp. WMMD712]|uniref:hypothetical protein n=1 Tax=Micromonospora sp. WMMD712 TaxID=3016096 RepID=UPI00249A7618|nr:hypothetical protein [Micromonospora sp. WMMD712]WFE58925.1 hypothetical protein O7633_19655 [Micromonospora sp. WMMD712]